MNTDEQRLCIEQVHKVVYEVNYLLSLFAQTDGELRISTQFIGNAPITDTSKALEYPIVSDVAATGDAASVASRLRVSLDRLQSKIIQGGHCGLANAVTIEQPVPPLQKWSIQCSMHPV